MNASSSQQLVVPIVVTWEQDRSQSIQSVQVHVSNSAGVDSLYLQIHNPGYRKSAYADQHGYDKKASVRVNGGQWIDIDNNRFHCQFPEKLYVVRGSANQGREGCIGGPLQTVRGSIAVNNFQDGDNTIEFRFNETEGTSSAYRILDLDVRAGTQSRMTTVVVEENPDQWQPIYTDQQSLAEGRELFEARRSLKHSPRDNSTIIASCADCHAADGRDLWYFNYDDDSIINRGVFHGLSREEGKKIASWIRALPDLDETIYAPSGYTVDDLGRPWNPPYQPGPGLRDKPVELWAAGAGLEWVLDSEREAPGTDRDMVTHMFPNGTQGDAAFDVVHPDKALNVDEIPIAIQLPDWNQWLPEIHPYDYWGSQSTVDNLDFFKKYHEMVDKLDNGNIESLIQQAASNPRQDRGIRQIINSFRPDYWYEINDPVSRHENLARWAIGRVSAMHWYTVKNWEVHQRHALEGRVQDIHPVEDYGLEIRPRGWTQINMSAFRVAAHMMTRPPYPTSAPLPDRDQNVFQSTQWYQLQLILNEGNKVSGAGNPMDWNYHIPHVLSAGRNYGHPQPLRFLQSQIVVKQARNNVLQGNFHYWQWNLRAVTPAEDFYGRDGYHRSQLEGALDQSLRRDILEATLRSFVEMANRLDINEWREKDTNMDPVDYRPRGVSDPNGPVSGSEFNQNHLGDSYYRYMNRAQQLGISPTVLDQAARWANRMWPAGNWDKYYHDGSELQVALVSPEEGASFEEPATIMMEADVSGGSVSRVEFYINGDRLGEVTSSPYRYEWSDVAAGSYELRARAYDGSGQVSHSSAVAFRVRAEGDEEEDDPIPSPPAVVRHMIDLEPGWNMVSSYVVPEDSSMEAIFAEVEDDIELVKDQQGRVYSPEFGINDIGMWDETEAYMVLARRNATLRLEGNGEDAASGAAVQLGKGWNYMPFLSERAVATKDLLESIERDVVFVKDLYGNIYFPEHGVDTIEELEPGRGYEVYLRRERSISYNLGEGTDGPSLTNATASLAGMVPPARQSANNGGISSPVSSILVLHAKSLPDGSVVSAWANDERFVGRAEVHRGVGIMVVAGDEPSTETVEGAREEDSIALRVQKEGSSEELDLRITRVADYLTGERKGEELTYAAQAIVGARVEELPVASLDSNYPNPFHESTTIPYHLREDTHVKMEVFDVLGRRVAVLVDDEQTAGDYEVELDAMMLSSGVYFYRIKAGSHLETGSMVVAR